MEPRLQQRMDSGDRTAADRYRRLIHLLNQRYRTEFDRAERLRAELADVKASRAWRWITFLRRLRHWLPRWPIKPPTMPAAGGGPASFTEIDLRQSIAAMQKAPPCFQPRIRDRISIIIPFKDRIELLRECLRGVQCGTHRQYEIILVDNGSAEARTHRFIARLEGRRGWHVITWPGAFNFSRLCNEGARRAKGDFLLFLNNDTEVINPDWLEQLLRVADHPLAGVVGATLFYPDLTIQHAGIFRQDGCVWSHVYRGKPADHAGELGELKYVREVPAVTAACMLIRRDVFQELGGFDERLPVTYNDIDLCRRVRRHGLRVFITPHAQLLHYESLSRGYAAEPLNRAE